MYTLCINTKYVCIQKYLKKCIRINLPKNIFKGFLRKRLELFVFQKRLYFFREARKIFDRDTMRSKLFI